MKGNSKWVPDVGPGFIPIHPRFSSPTLPKSPHPPQHLNFLSRCQSHYQVFSFLSWVLSLEQGTTPRGEAMSPGRHRGVPKAGTSSPISWVAWLGCTSSTGDFSCPSSAQVSQESSPHLSCSQHPVSGSSKPLGLLTGSCSTREGGPE